MRLLLDTHVFLWYVFADPKLPASYRAVIQNPDNELFVSVASIWESVIKHGSGKLKLFVADPPEVFLPKERVRHGINGLSIDELTLHHLAPLPPVHRDPFDRIIVAQALQHGLTIVTVDDDVRRYPVPCLPV